MEGHYLFILLLTTIILIYKPRQDNLWEKILWQGKYLLLGALIGLLLKILSISESYILGIYLYTMIVAIMLWGRGPNLCFFLGFLWIQYPYLIGLPVSLYIAVVLLTKSQRFALGTLVFSIFLFSLAYMGHSGALSGILFVGYSLLHGLVRYRLKGQSLTGNFAHTL